jgi:hypothetical protein
LFCFVFLIAVMLGGIRSIKPLRLPESGRSPHFPTSAAVITDSSKTVQCHVSRWPLHTQGWQVPFCFIHQFCLSGGWWALHTCLSKLVMLVMPSAKGLVQCQTQSALIQHGLTDWWLMDILCPVWLCKWLAAEWVYLTFLLHPTET